MRIAYASKHFEASDIGFIHAVGLAAHSGESEIVTLHVTQGRAESYSPPSPTALLERWGMAGARVAQRLHECPGHDDIADELIAACESLQPQLLIMATQARCGLARVFAGSIAEAVARNVSVPCLLLPLGTHSLVDRQSGALELRRVLIAGGSQRDTDRGIDAAAWFVRALAKSRTVELSLLHVDDGSPWPSFEALAGLSLKLNLRRGSVEHAMTSAVHEGHPDLIVMVSHGHDELRDVLLSSHTERVLHEAKRPLLWVPPSFRA
jgi:nucleotide-binding universal stress UspA family protein